MQNNLTFSLRKESRSVCVGLNKVNMFCCVECCVELSAVLSGQSQQQRRFSQAMVWPAGLQEVGAAAMFSCFVVDFL